MLLNSLNVDVGGLVFGISNTEVMPPATAALLPLSKFSASLAPGSLKCTWVSIAPGKTILPVASKTLPLLRSIFPTFLILFPDKAKSIF